MRKMFKLAALVQILLFSGLMVGCGKPSDQKANEAAARGEAALRGDDPAKAMSEFRSAVEHAEKMKRKDPNFDVAPFHANVGRAQTACADKARKLVADATALAPSNPERAMDMLSEAESLASARYGNAPDVQTAATQAAGSQDLAPAMARRQMDEYTRGINSWLFSRDNYSSSYGDYWEARSWYDVIGTKTRLENTLRNWQHPTATTALSQLSSLGMAFDLWRATAKLSYEPTQAQGILLMVVLEKHAQLRATLNGRESLNYWLLEQTWGVRQRGTGTGNGDWTWVGTGTGTGNGGTGTGNGGTGTGNGGTGTGNGTSGTGTGSGTGSGRGTGNGSGSSTGTGTGTGGGMSSGTGSGTGGPRPSTGTGTGSGSSNRGTGTGSGGSSRDEFGDINRSSGGTGSGTGGSSRGTGTGTGGGSRTGTGTGTGN